MRGFNWNFRQQPTAWDMFNQGLLSGFSKGQEIKQDDQDTQALSGLLGYQFTPQQTPEQQAAANKASAIQTGQQVSQANKGLLSDAGYLQSLGMTPDEVNASLSQTTAQPNESIRKADGTTAAVTPNMQATWDNNLNATINATPQLSLAQLKQQHDAAWGQQITGALKEMSPQARRQYMQQMVGMREQSWNQTKGNYADQTLNPMQDSIMTKLESLDSNKPGSMKSLLVDVAKYNNLAGQYGRNSMDMGLIKSIADDDAVTVDKIEVAGPDGVTMIQPVIKRKDGRPMLDKDGNQVANMPLGNPYSKGVSAEANLSATVAREGHAITASSARNQGGMTPATLAALYKDATEMVQEPTGDVNPATGQPIYTRRMKNPELAKRLEPYINSVIPNFSGGGQGGSGEAPKVDYYQGMNEATALIGSGKFNRQQIEAAVQQKYGDLAPYIIRDAYGGQTSNAVAPAFGSAFGNKFDPKELEWGISGQI